MDRNLRLIKALYLSKALDNNYNLKENKWGAIFSKIGEYADIVVDPYEDSRWGHVRPACTFCHTRRWDGDSIEQVFGNYHCSNECRRRHAIGEAPLE